MKPRLIRVERGLVYVPLPNGDHLRDAKGDFVADKSREAVLSLDDYRELLLLGVRPNWCLTGGNVMSRGKNGVRILVARVLLDAKPGQVVRFQDDNRLDLRRGNLSLAAGYSVNHDRAMLLLDREEIVSGQAGLTSAPIITQSFDELFAPV